MSSMENQFWNRQDESACSSFAGGKKSFWDFSIRRHHDDLELKKKSHKMCLLKKYEVPMLPLKVVNSVQFKWCVATCCVLSKGSELTPGLYSTGGRTKFTGLMWNAQKLFLLSASIHIVFSLCVTIVQLTGFVYIHAAIYTRTVNCPPNQDKRPLPTH